MYEQNIVVLSSNHYYSGEAISITCSQCVSVALVISMQRACAKLYSHLLHVRLYQFFSHYLINGTIFGEGGYYRT